MARVSAVAEHDWIQHQQGCSQFYTVGRKRVKNLLVVRCHLWTFEQSRPDIKWSLTVRYNKVKAATFLFGACYQHRRRLCFLSLWLDWKWLSFFNQLGVCSRKKVDIIMFQCLSLVLQLKITCVTSVMRFRMISRYQSPVSCRVWESLDESQASQTAN